VIGGKHRALPPRGWSRRRRCAARAACAHQQRLRRPYREDPARWTSTGRAADLPASVRLL